MKNIKVTFVNGDSFKTRINGTDNAIINHYNDNNFFNSNINEHVKEVEIESNQDELLKGQKSGKKVYLFSYDKKKNMYIY